MHNVMPPMSNWKENKFLSTQSERVSNYKAKKKLIKRVERVPDYGNIKSENDEYF